MQKRLGEIVDGEFQTLSTKGGAFLRENLFNTPELRELVANLSDEQLESLHRGGHDPRKVYNAYKAAVETTGRPTVILAHTIKGYGLGEAGEGRNITHQQKKLNEQEILYFRSRFEIPIPDAAAKNAEFFRPPADSSEIAYMQDAAASWAATSLAFRSAVADRRAAARISQGIARRLGWSRGFEHHGIRANSDVADEAQRNRQARRPDHSR